MLCAFLVADVFQLDAASVFAGKTYYKGKDVSLTVSPLILGNPLCDTARMHNS